MIIQGRNPVTTSSLLEGGDKDLRPARHEQVMEFISMDSEWWENSWMIIEEWRNKNAGFI